MKIGSKPAAPAAPEAQKSEEVQETAASSEPALSPKTSPAPVLGDTVIHHCGKGTNSAAIVTKVHSATCVNLVVFPDGHNPYPATSVLRVHPDAKSDGWHSRGESPTPTQE